MSKNIAPAEVLLKKLSCAILPQFTNKAGRKPQATDAAQSVGSRAAADAFDREIFKMVYQLIKHGS